MVNTWNSFWITLWACSALVGFIVSRDLDFLHDAVSPQVLSIAKSHPWQCVIFAAASGAAFFGVLRWLEVRIAPIAPRIPLDLRFFLLTFIINCGFGAGEIVAVVGQLLQFQRVNLLSVYYAVFLLVFGGLGLASRHRNVDRKER